MVVQTHPRNHLLKARVYHQWGSSLLEVVSRGSSAGTRPTTTATASGSMAVTSSPSFPLMRNESVDLSRETDSKKQQRKFEMSTLIIASRLLDSAAGAVRDNKGVGGEQLDEFSVCYNAGTAYLRLAGFSSSISLAPASKHDIPRSSARKYLQRAVSFFERASLADPSRLHALRNLAVAYARLGRTFDDDSVTQCQLFDAAISTHDKVLLLDPLNPESLFDAANCLFRFAGALSARLSPDTPSSTLSSPIFTSSGYDVLSLYRRAVSGYAQAIQQYQRAPGGSPASLPRSAFINLGLSLSAFLKALLRSPASLADPSLPSMLDAVVTEYLGFVEKQSVEWTHRFVPPVLTVLLKLDPSLLSSALSRQVLQQLSQFESRSTMSPVDSPPLVNSGGHPIGPDPAVVELTLSPCPSEPPSEPGFIFQEASLRAHGISELAVFRSLGQFASSKSCAFPRFLVQLTATAPERKPLHFLLQTVPRSALATQQWQGGSRSLLSVESRAYLLPVCLIYQNPTSLFVFFRAEAPLYGLLRSGTASSLFSDVKQTLAELLYAIMALAEAEGWVFRAQDLFVTAAGRIVLFKLPCAMLVGADGPQPVATLSIDPVHEMIFSAPEVLRGDCKHETLSAQVWTFGILSYYLAFRRFPFGSSDSAEGGSLLQRFLSFSGEIVIPQCGDTLLSSLLVDCLRQDHSRRLSSWIDVAHHPFFDGIDWPRMAKLLDCPALPVDLDDYNPRKRLSDFGKITPGHFLSMGSSDSDPVSSDAVDTLVAPGLHVNQWSGATLIGDGTQGVDVADPPVSHRKSSSKKTLPRKQMSKK